MWVELAFINLLHAVGASMPQRRVGYRITRHLVHPFTGGSVMQEGICSSMNTQHSLEYSGVGFYTSKILCKIP